MGRSPAVLFLLAMAVQSGIGAASTSNFKLNSEIFATPLAEYKAWMRDYSFRFILGGLRQYEMWKNSPYPGMAKRYAKTQPPEVQSLFEAWDREMEQDEGRMSGLEEALAAVDVPSGRL